MLEGKADQLILKPTLQLLRDRGLCYRSALGGDRLCLGFVNAKAKGRKLLPAFNIIEDVLVMGRECLSGLELFDFRGDLFDRLIIVCVGAQRSYSFFDLSGGCFSVR